jgi:hypothetical protein
MQPVLDFLITHISLISIGGCFGALIFKALAPRLSGSITRALKAALLWITTFDDKYQWTPQLHKAWDQCWGAIVGIGEQAVTPEMLAAFFRILRGKPSLMQERIRNQLAEHVSLPDFERLVIDLLPKDVKEVWNEAKHEEAVKAIVANAEIAGDPVSPAFAGAVVRSLAPAARLLAAENPIPKPAPITGPDILKALGRTAETQAAIEEIRAKKQK